MSVSPHSRPLARRPLARRAVAAAALVVLVGAACAGRKSADQGAARSNRNVITHEQIVQQNFRTALDAVQALRPNWLRTRGADSFQSPTQVIVYLDNVRMGGVDQLATITPSNIASITHFDGVQASGRWGLDHGAGVIQVISRVGPTPNR